MVKTKQYSLSQMAHIMDGKLYGEDATIDLISINSKEQSENGHCFFGIKGKTYDADDYAKEAVLNGAKVIVSKRKKCDGVSVICVKDINKAFLKFAEYNSKSAKIIGVTGSVGKTTVKDMIFDILSKKYKVTRTYKNQNNEIGVALTLLSIIDEDYCVVEMGMRGRGEIDFLSSFSHPYISVIRNATTAHIELLGSREEIFNAKAEILKNTLKYAILPAEKRFENLEKEHLSCVFVGEGGTVNAKNIEYYSQGIAFDICENNLITERVKIKSFSLHDPINALFAYEVGKICNVEKKLIIDALESFSKDTNRGGVFNAGEIVVIDDTYNASFESVTSAIKSLNEFSKLKNLNPYIMLGDMLEVGEKSEEYHFRIGELAKDVGIRNVFAYGKFAKNILDGFCGGFLFHSHDEAIFFIKKHLKKGDALLVKASRAAKFELIIEGLKE